MSFKIQQNYNIKDNLEILSNERFSEPIASGHPYGSVYTFEYETNGVKKFLMN